MQRGRSIFRATRRALPLMAMILALVATFASGGGVSRVVHLAFAHGGACGEERSTAAFTSSCAAHVHASCDGAPHADTPDRPGHDGRGSHGHHDCSVCAELAVQLLTPALASPFDLTIEVLAVVHTREAARQPTVPTLRALAARPPPVVL